MACETGFGGSSTSSQPLFLLPNHSGEPVRGVYSKDRAKPVKLNGTYASRDVGYSETLTASRVI